jgi:nucleoside-diphosphate-sugar epimerase
MTITGARSELGRLLSQSPGRDDVHFNLAGQAANTLLHDGHAWREFSKIALDGVRRALRADADVLVHASFAFVVVLPEKDPLRSMAQTILECEDLVLSRKGVAACVVRLGYLYGPTSADLRAYRLAFQIGRPYWAGSPKAPQYHLHHEDAVSALTKAASRKQAGATLYATDDNPSPFASLMDEFARRMGRRHPLHIPRIARNLVKLIVREEHMQQVTLAMPPQVPSPRVPGWRPKFDHYRHGLDQIVEAWRT